ncbi:MAG: hypothetical protein BGO76_06840 [Caedibacter sp. 38-128]|nr:hypothetical protein [Holosporales bacterium]OJX03849.1 MAG: hypothetical protein BGO76_06840 [Caedibacter sp. 38-128]
MKKKRLSWLSLFSILTVFLINNANAVDKNNTVEIETDRIDRNQAYEFCPQVCAKENREWAKAFDTVTYMMGQIKIIKGRCYCAKEQLQVKANSSEESTIEVRVDGLTGKATESTPRHNKECEEKTLFISGEHNYAFDERGVCPRICAEKEKKWHGKSRIVTNTKGYASCTQNSKGKWVMASNDLFCTCEK